MTRHLPSSTHVLGNWVPHVPTPPVPAPPPAAAWVRSPLLPSELLPESITACQSFSRLECRQYFCASVFERILGTECGVCRCPLCLGDAAGSLRTHLPWWVAQVPRRPRAWLLVLLPHTFLVTPHTPPFLKHLLTHRVSSFLKCSPRRCDLRIFLICSEPLSVFLSC